MSQFKPPVFCFLHNFDLFEDCCCLLTRLRKLFQIFLTAHVFKSTDCSYVVISPFFTQFTFCFLLRMFQTGHDAPPFAFIPERRNYSSLFCLSCDLPLIFLSQNKVYSFFCMTLLNLALGSNLTCRSSCDCSNKSPDFFHCL